MRLYFRTLSDSINNPVDIIFEIAISFPRIERYSVAGLIVGQLYAITGVAGFYAARSDRPVVRGAPGEMNSVLPLREQYSMLWVEPRSRFDTIR